MTTLPALNYISDAARTEAETKQALEDVRSVIEENPGNQAIAELTISGGSITPDSGMHTVETEAAAATDDLANIVTTNHPAGRMLWIRPSVSGHTVVVKDAAGGAGQIHLTDNADFTMDDLSNWLILYRDGNDWNEVGRFFGNDQAAFAAFYNIAGLALSNTFTQPNIFSGTVTLNGITTMGSQLRLKEGADIANASATLTLGADGNVFRVTGTTTIIAIATLTTLGTTVIIRFDDVMTLTHHATNLRLPGGADITTAAGDRSLWVEVAAGQWECLFYQPGATAPIKASGPVLLESVTIGAQTNADLTAFDNTTYNDYVVKLHNALPGNNDVELRGQISTDGGSNYLNTLYRGMVRWFKSTGVADDANGDSITHMILSADGTNNKLSNVSADSGYWEILLKNAGGSGKPQVLVQTASYFDSDTTPKLMQASGGGWGHDTAQDTNGFRLFFDSGDWVSGTLELWGIPKG